MPLISWLRGLNLTGQIVISMGLGILVGLLINFSPEIQWVDAYLTQGFFAIGGKLFINSMKMLVVPIVLVSLVCGTCSIANGRKLGKVGFKTLGLYILTTMLAITLGLTIANLFEIGTGTLLAKPTQFSVALAPSFKDVLITLIPENPFKAMVDANMLQVIIFALLIGTATRWCGEKAESVKRFFLAANQVLMRLIMVIMKITPIGVFCLIAGLFATVGFTVIQQLFSYFITVFFVLIAHVLISNTLLLRFLAKLNPIIFFKKMYPAMVFAFSVSSSNASIPVVLETVEEELGVDNSVASFVVPLGATINMDGTAIMQGVATVFIANAYGIDIGLAGYLTVIAMATLASVGTAGVPSVGLITLAMVLQQVGIPVEGIALIIGVDRLLDMVRTAVNVTGDAAVSCVVGKTENAIDLDRYQDPKGASLIAASSTPLSDATSDPA